MSGIAKKFNTTLSKLLDYNYMTLANCFISDGQKIAINGYAPRDYAVVPGEASSKSNKGTLVDWYKDGQFIFHKNSKFVITDTQTGTSFNAKMLGGYNHMDIEPITVNDTNIMKSLFKSWTWNPRPVAIYINGMNIAGSLSGMPHSFDTTPSNGVSGHFDVDLKNSKPHRNDASQDYVSLHASTLLKAVK